MTRLATGTLAFVGLLALFVAFAAPAQATPCAHKRCQGSFVVSPTKGGSFVTQERFSENDSVEVTLTVRGMELSVSPYGKDGCRAYYDGQGVTANVNVCGPRIRIKGKTIRSKRVKIKVTYSSSAPTRAIS